MRGLVPSVASGPTVGHPRADRNLACLGLGRKSLGSTPAEPADASRGSSPLGDTLLRRGCRMVTGRLLLIEDDQETRDALQWAFIRRGWEVAMVVTLAEGLTLLQDYSPRWIIASSDLPDGPCDPLLPRPRAARRRTRVAVVAASEDAARLAQLTALKPDILLHRPLDPDAVYRLCGGRPAATG